MCNHQIWHDNGRKVPAAGRLLASRTRIHCVGGCFIVVSDVLCASK